MSNGRLAAAAASASMADDEMVRQLQHDLGMDMSLLISAQDRKDQALHVLKSDLMAKLYKEVKSLDDDSWMFDGPLSRIDLISRPGGLRPRHSESSPMVSWLVKNDSDFFSMYPCLLVVDSSKQTMIIITGIYTARTLLLMLEQLFMVSLFCPLIK